MKRRERSNRRRLRRRGSGRGNRRDFGREIARPRRKRDCSPRPPGEGPIKMQDLEKKRLSEREGEARNRKDGPGQVMVSDTLCPALPILET